MPNGTRRGHYYTTRTGNRAWRGEAKIKAPVGPLLLLGGLVALGVMTGGAPLLAHPGLMLAVAAVATGGFVAWRGWKSGTKRRAAVRRDIERHTTHQAVQRNRVRVQAHEAKRKAKDRRRRDRLRQRQAGDRRTFTRSNRGNRLAAEGRRSWEKAQADRTLTDRATAEAVGWRRDVVRRQRAEARARQVGGRVEGDRIVCPDGRTYPANVPDANDALDAWHDLMAAEEDAG